MEPKLSRREMLSKSSVLLLLVPVAGSALHCGSSGSAADNPSTDNPSCQGVFETSTVTNDHTHTLCVPDTDLSAPASAGVTYTTSTNDGHNHTVALTQAQLQSIASGGSVTVTTSSPASHDFTISKA
jgi:hypothetical protein